MRAANCWVCPVFANLPKPSEERERELTFLPPNLIHIANHWLALLDWLGLFREPSEEGERENKSCAILIAENRVCIRAGFAKRVFSKPSEEGERE
jgi:hypothetical protein